MKSTVPVVTCDSEIGCSAFEIDFYEMGASVPKMPEGWVADGDYMLCPDCVAEGRKVA